MGRLVTGHALGIRGSRWWVPEGEWAHVSGRWGIRQGVQLNWISTGSEGLGNQFIGLWLTRFPIRNKGNLVLGIGPGWSSASYRDLGSSSFALATPWNLGLQVGVSHRIRLKAPLHLSTGLSLTHLSNGGLRLPNLGTNAACMTLAAHWGSSPMRYPEVIVPHAETKRQAIWNVGGRLGARDAGLPGGPMHPVLTLRGTWEWRTVILRPGTTKRTSNWSPILAAQLTLNQSRRTEEGGAGAGRWQPAILVGARWWAGNVSLQFAHGHLLAHASPEFGAAHLDAAVLWRVAPEWQLELGLRAFSMRAEHPSLGVTWVLPSRAILPKGR